MPPCHPSDCGGPFQLGACVRARRGPGGVTPGWLSALAPVALALPSPARRLQSCHFTPEGTQGPRAGPRPGPRAGARKTPGPGPGRQAIAAVSRAPRLGWPLSGVLENQAQSWGPGREGPCEVPGRVGAILNADRRPCTPAPHESGVSPQGLSRTSGRLWSLVSCPASLDMVTVVAPPGPLPRRPPAGAGRGFWKGPGSSEGAILWTLLEGPTPGHTRPLLTPTFVPHLEEVVRPLKHTVPSRLLPGGGGSHQPIAFLLPGSGAVGRARTGPRGPRCRTTDTASAPSLGGTCSVIVPCSQGPLPW